MSFKDDNRGVTVVIGAMLLFAFLIVAFSLYQANAVPAQNQEIEYQHSQQIPSEFGDFRAAVFTAGATGSGQSTQFTLGTQYPSRLIALNPPPAAGELRTIPTGEITIENAELQQESNADLYWEQDSNTYNTTGLAYEPQYNEYQNAPITRYEHSFIYNEFESGSVTVADQRVIQDEKISLWLLDGEISEQSSTTTAVDITPTSVPKTTVPVTNTNGEQITISLPTTLEADTAEMFIDPEEHDEVSNVAVENGQLQLVLEADQQYNLRIAQVGIGEQSTSTDPAYLVPVVGGTGVLEGQSFTVEVRDRYNNPVSGVEVTSDGCDGDLEAEQARTDEDGRASFTCTDVPPNQQETVTLSIGGEEWETVDFTVLGRPGGGGGPGNGGGGPPGGPPGQN